MAGVTPSSPDGGYQYFQRSISEIEDDLNNQARRAREREEAKTQSLQNAHDGEIRKRDEKLEETVNNIRQNANDTIEIERKRANADVERVKAQTYDRLGRFNEGEAQVLRKQVMSAEDDFKTAMKKEKQTQAESEQIYQQRIKDNYENYQDQVKQAVEAARKSANEAYHSAFESEREGLKEEKGKLQEQYSELSRDKLEESGKLRRYYEQAFADTKKDYDHRVRQTEEAEKRQGEARKTSYDDSIERAIESQKRGHEEETAALRAQIKELVSTEQERSKKGGDSISQAVRDYESDWRVRERLQQEAHDREARKLKDQVDQTEAYQNRIKHEALSKKDRDFTEAIQKQNQDTRVLVTDMESAFTRDKEQTAMRIKRDREASERAEEMRVNAIRNQSEKLFINQNENFLKVQKESEIKNKQQINYLENKLRQSTGYEDPTQIAPAAENAIRASAMAEYQKLTDQQAARNDRKLEDMHSMYSERYRELADESQSKEQHIRNQFVAEQNRDRAMYTEYLQDAEFNKEHTIRNKELDHDRQDEVSQKLFAKNLDLQRRQFEEQMETQRFDFENRMQGVKSEADHNFKMAQREFTAKYSDLSRNYEKQLSDQKEQYESMLEETKKQADKNMRENDKRAKTAIEQVERAFEQRQAQTESMHKERERLIAENYEIELEKARKTNAQLMQKKS